MDDTERALEVEAEHWEQQAAAGPARIARNMDPRALPHARFPVRFNHYELTVMQMAADLAYESKQRLARRAVREYCERKLRAAGVKLPAKAPARES